MPLPPSPLDSNTEDYQENSISIPSLGHLITDLNKLDYHNKLVASMQGLLPTKIAPDTSIQDTIDITQM